MPLDDVTKQRYIKEFTQLRSIDPPYTNWLLFSSTIESFLAKVKAPYDQYRVNSAIRKTEEWYTGDGWYADGPQFGLYMTSLAFLPLGLPASHPFWTDAPQPWTQVKAWGGEPFPKDHHRDDGQGTRDLF